MMQILFDGIPIDHKCFRFSGGEVQVRLPAEKQPSDVTLRADIRSSDDLIELLLVTDALRANYRPGLPIGLICPYLPYARQDRVCHPGEANSLSVICALLDRQGYRSIEIWDVHNQAAVSFVRTPWRNIPASNFVRRLISHNEPPVLVAPDEGAIGRATECAIPMGWPVVCAKKVRDPNDGKITGMTVDCVDIGSRDFLMVDDICDGGRTFIELAKLLRQKTTGRILLYVTHGIFSQGFDVFDGLINHIYTPNPFPAELPAMVTKL